jgi:putative heavy-metal chelation protein
MREPTINYYRELALKRRGEIDEASTTVEFVTAFVERAILTGDNHLYCDPYVLVQLASGAQGACFLHPEDLDTRDLDRLPGKRALDLLAAAPPYLIIALLDAVYCHLNMHDGLRPSRELEFNGTGAAKSRERAKAITSLSRLGPHSRVALIGLIVDIARCVLDAGGHLQVADLAEAGLEVFGVKVQHDARPLVSWADTVILTGNTLKTNTLAGLLGEAVAPGKTVLVYAMTGHHIAPRYLDYGVDIVTTEGFPYYWYANTKSSMKVYQRRS